MTARRLSKAKVAQHRAGLDLFGEVPITRQDVYAWLLAVVNLDPSSDRAFDYVRTYGVLNKIMRAKLDGTFDDLVAPARHSARFRELAAGRACELASNGLGLGEWMKLAVPGMGSKRLRAAGRPKEVVARERAHEQARKQANKAIDASMLRRLPAHTPPLSMMLEDIGKPRPEALARALGVSVSTVRRWIDEDRAPQSVMLALYWITRWGASAVDANAHNDAIAAASQSRVLQAEVDVLRKRLDKVGRIADFGSANDPVPNVPAGIATTAPYPVPGDLPSRREVPIVFTSIRSVSCADSGRKKKSA
jgi:predicted DNA-binding transcriptional regulator AlpA